MERSLWLSDRDLLLLSEEVDMVNFGLEGRDPVCGWVCEPMGVSSVNLGAAPFDASENRGMSFDCSASVPTGLWFGEGGIARPSLRAPPLPLPPG